MWVLENKLQSNELKNAANVNSALEPRVRMEATTVYRSKKMTKKVQHETTKACHSLFTERFCVLNTL